MDPLSALSIASSVLQFVQFGCSLVSKAHEIHQSSSGALPEHLECEDATTRLVELTKKIQYPETSSTSGCLSSDDAPLEAICRNCDVIATELLQRLRKLRLRDNTDERKWKSFRQALKTVWSKGEMSSIESRLLTCRKELEMHLIANTW
jgi:hypothetical protein